MSDLDGLLRRGVISDAAARRVGLTDERGQPKDFMQRLYAYGAPADVPQDDRAREQTPYERMQGTNQMLGLVARNFWPVLRDLDVAPHPIADSSPMLPKQYPLPPAASGKLARDVGINDIPATPKMSWIDRFNNDLKYMIGDYDTRNYPGHTEDENDPLVRWRGDK